MKQPQRTTELTQSGVNNEHENRLTKSDIAKSYKKTMSEMQSHLSIPSKIFSKIIHAPVIEPLSNLISSTIFRPQLIIAGAIGAISSIIVYLIAKKYGYLMAGSETILLFAIGWTIGVLLEYIRAGFFSKSK